MLNQMRDEIGKAMEGKGFHTDDGFAEGGMLRSSLAMTEIVEAMQEAKRKWGKEGVNQDALKDDIAVSAASTAIRLLDLAFLYQLNLDGASTRSTPEDFGRDDRVIVINKCGKIGSLIAKVYDVFEDLAYEYSEPNRAVQFYAGADDAQQTASDYTLTALRHLDNLCDFVGVDIHNAIEWKMQQNMNRPFRYGTPDEEKAS